MKEKILNRKEKKKRNVEIEIGLSWTKKEEIRISMIG